MNTRYLSLFAVLLAVSCSSPDKPLFSPDGSVKVDLAVEEGVPHYSISMDGAPVIENAVLGFQIISFPWDGKLIGEDGYELLGVKRSSLNETYTTPWGENKEHVNNYKEAAYKFKTGDGLRLTLRFRAFNDGVGFRYEVTAPGADSVYVMVEKTQFAFAEDGVSWSIPASFETYELDYREYPLSVINDANTPMTFRLASGIWGSIHEAALEDYPEMTLLKDRNNRHLFTANLAPWPDKVLARFSSDSFKTSWRTVQLGHRAVDLINSSLILNLNEPCVLEDTDWIKPMKYVGVWWGMHLGIESWVINDRHGATTENAFKYIDFAAANNIEGVLFEGWNSGWETWGGRQSFDFTKPYDDFDVDAVMAYAAGKGIEVIGHHETGANIPNYERQLEACYEWTAQKGMHYVKTGYAGGIPGGQVHHGQYGVRHYRKVVETAAKNHISLDVHEPIKETGIRRTYPNMMSLEGAKGMEWNAWSAGEMPEHYVVLPFTRLLGGPMDFTPGCFDILFENTRNLPQRKKWNDQDQGNSRVNTTLAAQIASWVVLYSPLQMASDLVENYEGHPAFQFFRDFDADCDWSEALCGEPMRYIAVVRRAGEKYFFGAMTNKEPRTLEIPLSFLGEGDYKAVVYADAQDSDWETNPQAYEIHQVTVSASDTLTVQMAPGGGQAVVFIPSE